MEDEGAPERYPLRGYCSGAFFLRCGSLAQPVEADLSRQFYPWLATLAFVATCSVSGMAQAKTDQKLDQLFQTAVAEYDAGKFAEAAAHLETLVPQVPKSFEAHELLGLVYASMSQDAKAIKHLEEAVRLKPESAEAHTNLAASLSRAGSVEQAGEQFRKALALEPQNYDANHNLGEFYVQSGKIELGRPLLERANQIDPSAAGNTYDLAMADFLTGHRKEARALTEGMIQKKDAGELHNLLGQIEEQDGNFVAAANQFEVAAHMDPSDDNLFAWGSELLLHRTYEPAIEVFRQASKRYPESPRLMIGLGMALYSRGLYEESVKVLLSAAALSPNDPRCYLFLSQAYDSSPSQAEDVIERFRGYAELQPNNALAQYYYAISLWKGRRIEGSGLDLQKIEALLKRSIELDGKLPEPHTQLGRLYADRKDYAQSIAEYQRSLELNPNQPDAHYRLGTDLVRLGQKDRAQAEFDIYQKQRAQHMADLDKERAEVQQFVYSSKSPVVAKP